jgi:hypothetical protein
VLGAVVLAALVAGAGSCGLRVREPAGPSLAAPIFRVTDLGAIRTSPHTVGRDGSYSALFAGHAVWLFGDTFLSAPDAQGRTMLSNSWSWTDDLNAANGISGFHERVDPTGAPTMLLQETAAESTFNAGHRAPGCGAQACGERWAVWPAAMVADPRRARSLVFYQLVSARPGEFNFHAVGYSVAVWTDFAESPRRPAALSNGRTVNLLFQENDVPFGSAALARDDTLYAYGCPTVGLRKPCLLGRVPLADVLDRSRWMYFTAARTWSSRIDRAVSVLDGNSIMSVSWNSYLGCYVAVYSRPLSLDVELRTAPSPQGPWSAPTTAFVARAAEGQEGGVYDALAHQEYDRDGGRRIYVTYSRSTGPFASELRLVEVQLRRADSN